MDLRECWGIKTEIHWDRNTRRYVLGVTRSLIKVLYNKKTYVGLVMIKEYASQKKLGIALGSGGAKGIAHIGVLEVLEEWNHHQ